MTISTGKRSGPLDYSSQEGSTALLVAGGQDSPRRSHKEYATTAVTSRRDGLIDEQDYVRTVAEYAEQAQIACEEVADQVTQRASRSEYRKPIRTPRTRTRTVLTPEQ